MNVARRRYSMSVPYVSLFGRLCLFRQVWSPDRVDALCPFDKNPFSTRKASPRTGDYMASEDGPRTAPARCATPVTTAESAILALFEDKTLADFEDSAKGTLEFAALPADTQSERQQSEFPAGVPRPHV